MAKAKVEYGNESISQLKGADRVRMRPAVIFGSMVCTASFYVQCCLGWNKIIAEKHKYLPIELSKIDNCINLNKAPAIGLF